jgi:hypothetical protein
LALQIQGAAHTGDATHDTMSRNRNRSGAIIRSARGLSCAGRVLHDMQMRDGEKVETHWSWFGMT